MTNSTNAPHITIAKNAKVTIQSSLVKADKPAADITAMDRNDLEQEVISLRNTLTAMQRTETIDPVSSLANRRHFLEIANAEFNRSRRYEHNLTLVVTDILGLGRIARDHGESAADHVVMSVAQMSLSSSRLGVDILGRISTHQIAIMLPETPLAGGLACIDRIRKLITTTQIILPNGEQVKPGLKVSVDTLAAEDENFMALFQRTWKRTAKSGTGKKAVA